MIGGLSRKGSVEEFEFWSGHGVDFMMLSVAYDFFFDDKKVSDVLGLKDRFGLNLLIHPRPDGRILESPANPAAHGLILEGLGRIAELIQEDGLLDKVVVHLSTYRIPGTEYESFTEEEAIANSRTFYRKLEGSVVPPLAVENAYPPGFGWEELGYKKEHFELFDLGVNCEFCLDTGHLNLSTMSVDDLLELPFEISCLHLHSNNGLADEHVPLMRKNYCDWKDVEALLAADRLLVVEIKRDLTLAPYIIEHLRANRIAP